MRRVILVLSVLFSFFIPLLSQQRDTTESLRGIGLRTKTGGGSSFFKRSWALIIGINEYVKANKLRYAVNDAEAIANLLIKKYGFGSKYVIKLYDSEATKDNILKAFERLIKETFEDDRVFVFFAGHGITMPLPEGKERGYILPVDADPSQPVLTAISTFLGRNISAGPLTASTVKSTFAGSSCSMLFIYFAFTINVCFPSSR